MRAADTRQTNRARATGARAWSLWLAMVMTAAGAMVSRPASALVLGAVMQPPAQEAPAVTQAAKPVNLNSASADELEALPGIGPATATRILEYRQKNGPFKKVEDLMNIKGIGEKSFLKLKPLVTVAASRERATD
jgi:comEA protein